MSLVLGGTESAGGRRKNLIVEGLPSISSLQTTQYHSLDSLLVEPELPIIRLNPTALLVQVVVLITLQASRSKLAISLEPQAFHS